MSTTRPMICIKCGYDLRGLPECGECPECGRTYDKKKLAGVAHAKNTYQKSEKITFLFKIVLLIFSALGIMVCSGILSYFAKTPSKPLISGGLISGMLLLMAIAMVVLKKIEENKD